MFLSDNLSIASTKILVRPPNWLGDAVMSTTFPRELKKQCQHSNVHVIVKKPLLSRVATFFQGHTDTHSAENVILVLALQELCGGMTMGFWRG